MLLTPDARVKVCVESHKSPDSFFHALNDDAKEWIARRRASEAPNETTMAYLTHLTERGLFGPDDAEVALPRWIHDCCNPDDLASPCRIFLNGEACCKRRAPGEPNSRAQWGKVEKHMRESGRLALFPSEAKLSIRLERLKCAKGLGRTEKKKRTRDNGKANKVRPNAPDDFLGLGKHMRNFVGKGEERKLRALFKRAEKNRFSGNRIQRKQASEKLLDRLLYCETKRRRSVVNDDAPLEELHRALMANLSSIRREDGLANIIGLVEFVSSRLNENAEWISDAAESAIPTKDRDMVDFFADVCWIQWCVICASPYGENAHETFSPGRKTKKQPSTGQLNYVNCCLAVLYDMADGYVVDGRLLIPKIAHVCKHVPPMSDLPKHGYRKTHLTSGIGQRTACYKSFRNNRELKRALWPVEFPSTFDIP